VGGGLVDHTNPGYVIMLLVVTREGYSREGWKSFGPAPAWAAGVVDRVLRDV